jgi:hypothetical protein
MRNVIIKVIIEDNDTETKVEGIYTLNQSDTLNNYGLNSIEVLIPQLNRELTEKLGYHEEILREVKG